MFVIVMVVWRISREIFEEEENCGIRQDCSKPQARYRAGGINISAPIGQIVRNFEWSTTIDKADL